MLAGLGRVLLAEGLARVDSDGKRRSRPSRSALLPGEGGLD
jgi:hypothetical protein